MKSESLIDSRTNRKRMTPGEAAERMRGSRTLLSEKTLGIWGIANVYVIFAQMFLSGIGSYIGINIGNLNKYFMFSLALWILVVLLQRAAPLRLPGAIICMIGVQVWFAVSTIVSQLQLARSFEFMAPDYSLVVFLLCFIQGSMLAYFVPQFRVVLKRLIVGVCLVSAFVAVLQFMSFGPAIAYANLIIRSADIADWGGQGGIRAVGIFSGLVSQTTYCLIAIGMIASALYKRKLTIWEIGAVVFLIGIMFMAQVRSLLPVIAVVLIPLIVLFVRKQGRSSIPYVFIGLIVLAMLIMQSGDRFAYMFSGDTSTFEYRTDVLWPQALHIYSERPWFGIGVEPAFAGFGSFTTDRWSSGVIMDNGYLVSLAFGGIPALTFMILAVLAGVFGSFKLLLRRSVKPIERGFVITTAIIVLMFGFGMLFHNLFMNITMAMLFFVLIGFALPSRPTVDGSGVEEGRRRLLTSADSGAAALTAADDE